MRLRVFKRTHQHEALTFAKQQEVFAVTGLRRDKKGVQQARWVRQARQPAIVERAAQAVGVQLLQTCM